MRRYLIGVVAVMSLFLFSGCYTVKDTVQYTAKGTVAFLTSPFYGLSKGIKDDTTKKWGVWPTVKRADDWFEENYW